MEVIVYRGMDPTEQNRGFCFVEFADHEYAEEAHKYGEHFHNRGQSHLSWFSILLPRLPPADRKITNTVFTLGARRVNVDWAQPEQASSNEDPTLVRVLLFCPLPL